MCENNGYTRLIIKGLIVVIIGLFAIFRPDILTFWFTLSYNRHLEGLSHFLAAYRVCPHKTNDTEI